jgi:hypothetical protein
MNFGVRRENDRALYRLIDVGICFQMRDQLGVRIDGVANAPITENPVLKKISRSRGRYYRGQKENEAKRKTLAHPMAPANMPLAHRAASIPLRVKERHRMDGSKVVPALAGAILFGIITRFPFRSQ